MLRILMMLGLGLLVNFSCLLNALSAEPDRRGRPEEPAYAGTLAGSIGDLLFRDFPTAGAGTEERFPQGRPRSASSPALMDRGQMESVLKPSGTMASVGNLPAVPDTESAIDAKYRFLEIEVSHSMHTFKLWGVSPTGMRDSLYECRIGLGSSEFPTPVGTYFVTHIYDDSPWWIPPKDRAWAAGDSPSRTVYGGTMAPLLKKRPLSRKKISDPEDMIEGPMKFDDYGYRFHGTNAPRSIGHNQSHGCVRMLSDDARKVASLIKDYVGAADRRESENGTFVILNAPVRLNLVK
ncbi:MAG: L,D-transpeptidase [Desulfomonile tiedjei]|uniref:L,D-transpeptidase n=1 Tax=Desulfomonile tiedjei TaxID=2358 RepID=A0A9D6Z506_9BACT|nr:L,D-transpeptidase [Desulfomonile tiedjei]